MWWVALKCTVKPSSVTTSSGVASGNCTSQICANSGSSMVMPTDAERWHLTTSTTNAAVTATPQMHESR